MKTKPLRSIVFRRENSRTLPSSRFFTLGSMFSLTMVAPIRWLRVSKKNTLAFKYFGLLFRFRHVSGLSFPSIDSFRPFIRDVSRYIALFIRLLHGIVLIEASHLVITSLAVSVRSFIMTGTRASWSLVLCIMCV